MHRNFPAALAAIVVFTATLAPPLCAQSPLERPRIVGAGASPVTSRVNIDVNVDGRPDLVFVTSGRAWPSVQFALPGGGLDETVPFPGNPTNPRLLEGIFDLFAVDVDRDGEDELLVLHRDDNDDAAFTVLNRRGQTVLARSGMPVPREAQIVDLGADGELDLVLDVEDAGIIAYELSPFAFAFPIPLVQERVRSRRWFFGDFDADGVVDLLWAPRNSSFVIHRVSFGVAGGALGLPTGEQSIFATLVTDTEDLDGDGDDDLIGYGASGILGFLSNGAGRFGPSIDLAASSAPLGASVGPGVLFDVDLDGVEDMVWSRSPASGSPLEVVWSRGLGGLGFGPETPLYDASGPAFWPTVPALLDVDADGDEDLVFVDGAQEPGSVLAWCERLTPGSGAPFASTQLLGVTPGVNRSMVRIDANGDSALDLIVLGGNGLPGSTAGRLVFYPGDGAGGFRAAQLSGIVEGWGALELAGDLDGDGNDDLVITERDSGRVRIVRSRGDGTFEPARPLAPLDEASPALAIGDNDFDGVMELYAVRDLGAALEVWVYDGVFDSAGPAVTSTPLPGASGSDVVLGQLDADTSIDVLYNDGTQLMARAGLPGGSFGPATSTGSTTGQPDVGLRDLVDLDGDGARDVIARVDEVWSFALGLGAGSLALSNLSILEDRIGPIRAETIFFGDVDGAPGVEAFASRNGPGLRFLRWEQSASRLEHASAVGSTLTQPVDVVLADLDGFGGTDVVIAGNDLLERYVSKASPPVGTTSELCRTGIVNSTGVAGEVRAVGFTRVGIPGDFELRAIQLPPGQPGMFLGSMDVTPPAPLAGSSGELCLGGSIGRYAGPGQVKVASPAGAIRLPLRADRLRDGSGIVGTTAGTVWHFQAWYRDTQGGVPLSNLTNALSITFGP